jgi:diguanylate cyclase
MAALVAPVREAVITVGAEVGGLHNSVDRSAGRFETIAGLDDPKQIKARLVAGVTALKHAAAERRQIWESTSKKFSERVETLERQLVSSRNEASLDSLTGIANRRTFDRTCQDWVRSARSRFVLAVLAVLDVDDFKSINDTRGHAAGDQVLVALAQALLGSVRPGDIVARLGGDEFAILASDLTLRQAESRFARTIADLGASDAPVTPKVSCGLAEYSAGDPYESLFERADQALYAAKCGGKHRVATKARAFIRDLMKR